MAITINDYVMANLIYCQDTHSFICRIYKDLQENGIPESKDYFESIAWNIVKQMNEAEQNGD